MVLQEGMGGMRSMQRLHLRSLIGIREDIAVKLARIIKGKMRKPEGIEY